MSYQVLARKWRPQTFHELVGQVHVKQALVNALEQQRLHHAYLFTGTRGVGKTTIARIFAKSLNCDQGITSTPCGQCDSCSDIEAGRFIDLIEVDAASRTKVEDTREILDNVQYAPTRGRYKVYLIDEVHMLSKNSFNALLKTLEEPPEHVKFLLATTDPQKLPVTILSRCLQFNLAALSVVDIKQQLTDILTKESISHQDKALDALAIAANGSMRDALSLTDQAIAQTNSQITLDAIQQMLGLMDISFAKKLLSCVIANEGETLLEIIEQLQLQNGNFNAVLDDLLNLCHLVLLSQLVPGAAKLDQQDSEFILELAQHSEATQIQVYYQLLLNGKKDLTWAPNARLGFEMVMLRLLAFEPLDSNVMATPTATQPEKKARPSLKALLRDVKSEQSENEHSVPPKSVAPAQPQHTNAPAQPINNEVSQQAVPPSEAVPAEAAQNTVEQNQAPAMVEQQQAPHITEQTTAANNLIDDAQIAAQYHEVMAQAEQSQRESQSMRDLAPAPSNELVSEPEPTAQPEPDSQAASFSEQLNSAESAIADILKRRNISGSGVLNKAQGNAPAKKTEPQTNGAEQAEQSVDTVKPQPAATKPSPLSRFKGETDNVAPELIEQLAPVQQTEPAVVQAPEPLPEGFTSPISDIKFAHQQDDWANMIEQMQLGGRVRQFALHSLFSQQENLVTLVVDQQQQHLDSAILRESLVQAFSKQLNCSVELTIEYQTQMSNTPYLIQQHIDEHRLQQAIHTIKHDETIVQMVTRFDANIDISSIQAL